MTSQKSSEGIVSLLDETMPEILHSFSRCIQRCTISGFKHNLKAVTITIRDDVQIPSYKISTVYDIFTNTRRSACHQEGYSLASNTDDQVVHDYIVTLLRSRHKKYNLVLLPEYSDGYRLHYHGILECSDADASCFKKWCNKNIGFACIKELKDHGYIDYCTEHNPSKGKYKTTTLPNIIITKN